MDYITAGVEDICQQRGRHFVRERYYTDSSITHITYIRVHCDRYIIGDYERRHNKQS